MSTRLSTLIAQCVTSDGKLDRVRLLDALHVSPDDPTALIIDAALHVEMDLIKMRAVQENSQSEVRRILQDFAELLRPVLDKHLSDVDQARELLVGLAEELSVARSEAQAKLTHDSQALVQAAEALTAHAAAVKATADRLDRRPSLVLFGIEVHMPRSGFWAHVTVPLISFVVGVCAALAFYLYLLRK